MKFVHRRLVKLMLITLILIAACNSLLSIFFHPLETGILRWLFTSSISYSSGNVLEFGSVHTHTPFDIKARTILRDKRNAGIGRSLHFLDPTYVSPTQVKTPEYFLRKDGGEIQKPVTHPFDPRFTLSVYFEWMRQNPGKPVPFHWSDWLNLSPLNDFILSADNVSEPCTSYFTTDMTSEKKIFVPLGNYCTEAPEFPLGFKVTSFPGAHTKDNAILLAKSYLYSGFAAPSRIVFLTNSQGAYIVEVANHQNDVNQALLRNGMPEQVLSMPESHTLDVLESYKSLLAALKPHVISQTNASVIHLKETWFDMDIKQTMSELHMVTLSKNEAAYLDSLQFSISQKSPPKALFEAEISSEDENHILGRHYDWRFFDGYSRGTDTQVAALHRMVRTYLKFCQTNGLVTWIAHGSLLSWYWNGLAFPWDLDADVQMPIRDLHRLARDFNQTLVLENVGHDRTENDADMEFNGMGAYFIDVGSSITHRNAGNGLNRIDARFIDIHTGLYVDITGLAVTEEIPLSSYVSYPQNWTKTETREKNRAKNLYNCRNKMWASLQQLSPLTKTLVDNEIGYIPHDFKSLLLQEYQSTAMFWPIDSGYEFVQNLRFWVESNTLSSYLKDPHMWVREKSQLSEQDVCRSNGSSSQMFPKQEAVNLLYEETILGEYLRTSEFTKFHEHQPRLLLENRTSLYFSNIEKYQGSESMGKALYDDSFMRKLGSEQLDWAIQLE